LLSIVSRPSLRHSGFFARVDAFQRKYRIGANKTGIQVHKTAEGNKGPGVHVRMAPLGAPIWML